MRTVRVYEAKAHFSALLARVEQGEEIVVARRDKPIARLVALRDNDIRPMGVIECDIPDTIFDELPEDELAAWAQ